jgi:ABC-2 type transport system permease protein
VRSLPAYAQIVNMGIQMIAAYRVQAILETASMLLQVFLLRAIWEAVYAGQNQIDGRPLSLVIAYVTIATIQNWLLSPNLAYFLAELVLDGSVGIELVRPVPFLGRLLAQQGGETAFALPFAIAAFPLAVWLGGMLPPASPTAAALYVVSVGLGYGIMVLIGLMIGLASFWTIEIFGFVMIYRLVSAFFGGALIPLWFFPAQLSAVADWLPFQSMLFVPIAIYLGQLTGGDAARAIALQLLWIFALYVAVQTVWRHAMQRVVVQGG